MLKNWWLHLKNHKPWSLILAGSFIWSLTMVKSGLVYAFGVGFWGPNGHDGVWHLALINSLSRPSLEMPVFAGEMLKNYHFGFDLMLAIIHRLTYIPSSLLYFQIIPPLLAIGIGYFGYKFVLAWTKNQSAALWSLFFIYFGGSFGWLVNLLRGTGFGGESMFWAQQSISTLINPPFALSILIIFFVLYRLSISLTPKTSRLVGLSLLIGSLSIIKIYAAILFLPGLALASFRHPQLRKLLILSGVFSLLFYLPFNHQAVSLVVFQPFWFVENMLALSDRFFWPKMYQAMMVYKITRNLVKFIPAYGLMTLLFVVGNLGLRTLGLVKIKELKKLDTIAIILWTMAGLGLLFPLLFIQHGTPWNPIQFFYYTQFILGIFTAIFLAKNKHILITVACLLFTLPTTLDTLRHYLPSRPPAMISKEELSALNFLSSHPNGTVFTPLVSLDPYLSPPRPLYKYESTAYVSAYANKPVYLEDTVNLSITEFPYKARFNESLNFMSTKQLSEAKSFLGENHIRYLYLPEVAKVRPYFSAQELGGKVIFENSQVSIWSVL
jgi:hypothetical protein